jgi:hypothetical protein
MMDHSPGGSIGVIPQGNNHSILITTDTYQDCCNLPNVPLSKRFVRDVEYLICPVPIDRNYIHLTPVLLITSYIGDFTCCAAHL